MVGYDTASKQRWLDYHNQHESAAFIGLFHATSSVLPSVESYPNYRKLTQRGVQGYLSSLQRRVYTTKLEQKTNTAKVEHELLSLTELSEF